VRGERLPEVIRRHAKMMAFCDLIKDLRQDREGGGLSRQFGRPRASVGGGGDYHGWVVGVSLSDPGKVISWSTRARGGGIWARVGSVPSATLFSWRPATRLALRAGAMAKPYSVSHPICTGPATSAITLHRRIGMRSTSETSTSGEPHRSPSRLETRRSFSRSARTAGSG
jgi:hypothetical protein